MWIIELAVVLLVKYNWKQNENDCFWQIIIFYFSVKTISMLLFFFLIKKCKLFPMSSITWKEVVKCYNKTAFNSWGPVFKVSSEPLAASSLAMLVYFLQQDNPYELRYLSQDATCDCTVKLLESQRALLLFLALT